MQVERVFSLFPSRGQDLDNTQPPIEHAILKDTKKSLEELLDTIGLLEGDSKNLFNDQ